MFKMFAAKTINSHNASVFSVEHGTRMIYNYIYKKKPNKTGRQANRPTVRWTDSRMAGCTGRARDKQTDEITEVQRAGV